MALRMGLDLWDVPGTSAEELAEILKTLPPEPMVSKVEWARIEEFYVENAPETLPPGQPTVTFPLDQFEPAAHSLPIGGRNSLTLLHHDSLRRSLYVGTREGKLFALNSELIVTDSVQLPSPPSHLLQTEESGMLLTCMGIMDPNDLAKGSVIGLLDEKEPRMLIDSLKRPVYTEKVDLNNDGRGDLLISAFGNFSGGLLAYEKLQGAGYRKHRIYNFPGTRKTIAEDFNGDGLTDIIALVTQGDEKIAMFTNRGNFRFSYQVLLRFPPAYGSSYFELVDFDGDGNRDILYTNGDNADYSPILKPYHGVRLFLNDGRNHFSESWFYPLHGASMVRAHDFDDDGDLDIAAISFFPDFKRQPEKGFIYLRNDGGSFSACSTPLAAASRWIAMELADVEGDGDEDILVAALAFPTGVPDSLFRQWNRNKYSLLVLKNRRIP